MTFPVFARRGSPFFFNSILGDGRRLRRWSRCASCGAFLIIDNPPASTTSFFHSLSLQQFHVGWIGKSGFFCCCRRQKKVPITTGEPSLREALAPRPFSRSWWRGRPGSLRTRRCADGISTGSSVWSMGGPVCVKVGLESPEYLRLHLHFGLKESGC